MTQSSISKWVLLSLGFSLAFLLIAFLFPAGNQLSLVQIKQVESDQKLLAISKIVHGYKATHQGLLPDSLSESLPRNRVYFADMFQVSKPAVNSRIDNISSVDMITDYVIASDPGKEVLMFEKPGLWADGSVAICNGNLEVKRLSYDQFLKSGLKPRGSK